MTSSAVQRRERGEADRSSRPLSILVMSADGKRRGDWAKFFEDQGMQTIRCGGPQATSCALELSNRCPLHEHADLIFYDEESITPALEEQLDLIPLSTPVAYARTMRTRLGDEYPVTERVRPAARPLRPSR